MPLVVRKQFFYAVLMFISVMSLTSLACNVQIGAGLIPVSTPSTSIVFLAPSNGSVIAAGATIELAALVTDTNGSIAKVEFFRDDQTLLGTVLAPQPTNRFVARQAWSPKDARGYLITAHASRADGAPLGDVSITVQVVTANFAPVGANATPTLSIPTLPSGNPTQSANIGNITITLPPNAPTLRVTAGSLNIRSGPGTVYPVLATMNFGDVAAVIGRNADSNWYVVQRTDGVRGWVTSSPNYSAVAGDIATLALVAAPPTPAVNASATPIPALAATSTPLG